MYKIILKSLILSFLLIDSLNYEALAANNLKNKIIPEIERDAEQLVGGAIAIVSGKEVIYKKTFGHKKVNGDSIDENTMFGLASVSKAITATAIAALRDKGKISFEDNVNINSNKVPLKRVLSHTTGYSLRGDKEIERDFSREDLLELLSEKTTSNGNNSYLYSNIVYSLTQDYLKEKGSSLEYAIDGLHISAKILPLENLENFAYPHSRSGELLDFPSNYQKAVPASAGAFSSLNGMVDFLQIILGNRQDIVSKKTLNELFKPMAEARDVFSWNLLPFKDQEVQSWYCLGWRKLNVKKVKNSTLIFHSGFINGATAFVGVIPEHNIGIVVMSNQSSPFPLKSGLKIWKSIIQS